MGIRRYGTSNDEQVALDSAESREIVAKILEHGISQRQILYIIHDLAMNLEHPDHMQRLVTLAKDLADDDVSNITSPLAIE